MTPQEHFVFVFVFCFISVAKKTNKQKEHWQGTPQ